MHINRNKLQIAVSMFHKVIKKNRIWESDSEIRLVKRDSDTYLEYTSPSGNIDAPHCIRLDIADIVVLEDNETLDIFIDPKKLTKHLKSFKDSIVYAEQVNDFLIISSGKKSKNKVCGYSGTNTDMDTYVLSEEQFDGLKGEKDNEHPLMDVYTVNKSIFEKALTHVHYDGYADPTRPTLQNMEMVWKDDSILRFAKTNGHFLNVMESNNNGTMEVSHWDDFKKEDTEIKRRYEKSVLIPSTICNTIKYYLDNIYDDSIDCDFVTVRKTMTGEKFEKSQGSSEYQYKGHFHHYIDIGRMEIVYKFCERSYFPDLSHFQYKTDNELIDLAFIVDDMKFATDRIGKFHTNGDSVIITNLESGKDSKFDGKMELKYIDADSSEITEEVGYSGEYRTSLPFGVNLSYLNDVMKLTYKTHNEIKLRCGKDLAIQEGYKRHNIRVPFILEYSLSNSDTVYKIIMPFCKNDTYIGDGSDTKQ